MASASEFAGFDAKTAGEGAASPSGLGESERVTAEPATKKAKTEGGPAADPPVTPPGGTKAPQTVKELCVVLKVSEKLAQAFFTDLGGDLDSSL